MADSLDSKTGDLSVKAHQVFVTYELAQRLGGGPTEADAGTLLSFFTTFTGAGLKLTSYLLGFIRANTRSRARATGDVRPKTSSRDRYSRCRTARL